MDIEDLRREKRLAAEALAKRFNEGEEEPPPQPKKPRVIKPISTVFTPEKERPTLKKPEASTSAPKQKRPEDCKNKGEVISYILELQELSPLPDGKTLRKTNLETYTRDDLNALCASMIDRQIENLDLPKPKETYTVVKDEKGDTIALQKLPESPPSDAKSAEIAAEALYSFQSLVISVLELSSVNLGPRFGLTSDIEGLGADVDKKKTEIKAVLAKIYQEYGPQITYLLKPLNQYGFIMLGLAQSRYIANKDKKNTHQPSLIVSSTAEPGSSSTG